MKKNNAVMAVFVCMSIFAFTAGAVAEPKNDVKPSDVFPDFAPPDLSAFTLLGVSPTNVARPSSVRELAISTVNASGGGSGTIAPDLAVEWSPYTTFSRKTLETYRRTERRMLFTVGTAKDGDVTRFAVGGRWAVVDRADPVSSDELIAKVRKTLKWTDREAWLTEVNDIDNNQTKPVLLQIQPNVVQHIALRKLMNPQINPDTIADLHPFTAERVRSRLYTEMDSQGIDTTALAANVQDTLLALSNWFVRKARLWSDSDPAAVTAEGIKELLAAYKKDNWNATTVQFAVGLVSKSENSSWEKLQTEYWKTYLGGGFGIGTKGQLLFQISYDEYVRQTDSLKRKLGLGTRIMLGGVDARGTAELHYLSAETKDQKLFDQPLWSLTFGGEMKLTDGLWLEVTLKNEFLGGDDAKGKMLTLANLRYALTEKPKGD
ncbi:hypothetical protein KQH82_08045 [bacterium]|nr:hypothetical protein [bacterium]